MRIYISASDCERAKEAVLLLGTVLGHEVVSRWHAQETRPKFKDAAGWAERVRENLADIERAEVVVSMPEGNRGCYGSQLEVGYAMRGGTPVVLLARKLPSALLRHPLVTHVTTADGLEAELKRLAEAVKEKPKKAARRKTAVK